MVLSPENQRRRNMAAAKRALGPAVLSQISEISIDQLAPYPQNARKHSDEQYRIIGQSIQTFGWLNPPLIDNDNVIIAGHGRIEAARRIGLVTVPVLRVDGLTPDQLRAYRLADNRIAEIAGWDHEILAIELQHLVDVDIGCGAEILGWKPAEVEILIGAQSASNRDAAADECPPLLPSAVNRIGDLWRCGHHRLLCGAATDPAAFDRLTLGQQAQLVCQDPAWNIALKPNVGAGRTTRHEFETGVSEINATGFRQFVADELQANTDHAAPGAVLQVFIDWRGVEKVIAAGEILGLELINVLVWVKDSSAATGVPWRSSHEMIVVFRKQGAKIKNRVATGKVGRNRTNVLEAPDRDGLCEGRKDVLDGRQTRKPVELIADLIRDVTDIGDVVLDTFLGWGTVLVAAEQTGRRCFGMEQDPLYADTAIRRWQMFAGEQAFLDKTGESFAEVEAKRASAAVEAATPSVPSRSRRWPEESAR